VRHAQLLEERRQLGGPSVWVALDLAVALRERGLDPELNTEPLWTEVTSTTSIESVRG
jgi:hypothetical protein